MNREENPLERVQPEFAALVESEGWKLEQCRLESSRGEASIAKNGLRLRYSFGPDGQYYYVLPVDPIERFAYPGILRDVLGAIGLDASDTARDFRTVNDNEEAVRRYLDDPNKNRARIEAKRASIRTTYEWLDSLPSPHGKRLAPRFLQSFPWLRKRTEK